MQYLALATDYDGTIAHEGRVDSDTIAALERFRASGRKLILVTGRELEDLVRVFDGLALFDSVVLENGALLYHPETREAVPLAPPPPAEFVTRLRSLGVAPLSVGRVIVATWEPNEPLVLEAIRELGLDLQIIFNKGAVMVLPAGVTKATGLATALGALGLSPHNVVGVGDAQNDHAFLTICGCAVAVANALPELQRTSDLVTAGARGAGVAELVARMIDDDLAALDRRIPRQQIALATPEAPDSASASAPQDALAVGDLAVAPHRATLMLSDSSGGGKSTVSLGLLERLTEAGFQFCVIDPEGDYDQLEGAVVLGDDPDHPPTVEAALAVLAKPEDSLVLNLLGLPLEDRPGFFAALLPHLLELRARTGRPHVILVDEAHHMLPAARRDSGERIWPSHPEGVVLITVHPDSVDPTMLRAVDHLLVVGAAPQDAIAGFCRATERPVPALSAEPLPQGLLWVWAPTDAPPPQRMRVLPSRGHKRRHRRKYAAGELGENKSFYFRGPEGRLNLRAQNLVLFLQMAAGVDDATWRHHARAGDYSRWFRDAIKDPELADQAAAIEAGDLPIERARARLQDIIERRYTAPG